MQKNTEYGVIIVGASAAYFMVAARIQKRKAGNTINRTYSKDWQENKNICWR